MTIKNGFVPCAGLGSRMGPLGKIIPKPLWPVFEKSMLEIQQAFIRSLGIEYFFANTHHQASQIEKKNIDDNLNFNLLYEKNLLGNGGNFHNLKKEFPNVEKILVTNPDVFLMMSNKDWKRLFEECEQGNNLVLMPCNDRYNEVHTDEDGNFLKVTPPQIKKTGYLTYTGVSVINLTSFPYIQGESSFFESVVSPRLGNTTTFIPQDTFEYWDFGTLDLYRSNIAKLLKEQGGLFWNFLVNNELIFTSSCNGNLYESKSKLFRVGLNGVSIRQNRDCEFSLL